MKTKLFLVLFFIAASVMGQTTPASQTDVIKVEKKVDEAAKELNIIKTNVIDEQTILTTTQNRCSYYSRKIK